MEEFFFNSGAAVEVNLEGETSCDAWFPAHVVKEIGKNYFLVEYNSSRNSDLTGPQKVTVDINHIRPSPPGLQTKTFELLDKIEAFYDFGWWNGVITKVLPCRRFLVYFKHAKKDKELSESEMRPHMEWKDGKWVSSAQRALVISGYRDQARHGCKNRNSNKAVYECRHSCSGATENDDATDSSSKLTKNRIEHSTICDENSPSDAVTTSSKKRMKLTATNGDAAVLILSKNLNEGSAVPTASSLQMLSPETIFNGESFGFASPTAASTGNNSSRQPSVDGQPSIDAENTLHGKKIMIEQLKFCGSDNQATLTRRKRGRPKKFPVNCLPTSMADEASSAAIDSESGVTEKGCIKENVDKPVVPGLAFGSLDQTLNAKSPELSSHQMLQLNTPEIVQPNDGQVRTQIERPRGKRLRLRSKYRQKASKAGKDCEIEGAANVIRVKGSSTNKVDTHNQLEEHSSKKRRMAASNGGPASEDTPDDDRPLSLWIEEMSSPIAMDASRLSDRIVSQLNNGKDKQDENAGRSPEVCATGDNMPDGNQSSYVMKSSPIWKTIESMEAFKLLPQSPHFHPLVECREEFREGLAIGSMVAFANLVEKISKWQFDYPRSMFDSILSALCELELHGFDVKAIRGRVNELLPSKEKEVQLLAWSEEVKSQIMQHCREKTKIDEEIDEINNMIKELEEKRSRAMTRKETRVSEIAMLRSSMDSINEEIQHARFEFEQLAAAPLGTVLPF